LSSKTKFCFASSFPSTCGTASTKVIEATNADEAIVVLQQPQLAVDVIFSDIEMPGSMDGFGLAQWARSNRPGLDVILTGSVPRAMNAAADLCESSGTVLKPYEP
jgi:DNA-binding LytR/AlgR family response regulator